MKRKVYPYVSFIIPTLNEEVNLPKCLASIRNQHYPQKLIEIIVADGGSKDATVKIAKSYHAKVIPNPDVLHEQGKARASAVAKGDIIFYTDADNILSTKNWVSSMIKPYQENPHISGFLPQTIPAPDSNSIDRYLGYLFTDPFTWFIYRNAANPKDYHKIYHSFKITRHYRLYKFPNNNIPLFGLSQGVGVIKSFKKEKIAYSDDLLAGIKLIQENGIIAYVPNAGIYHYHVDGLLNFIRKYTWRIRNNLRQQIKGMGLVNRTKYFPKGRIVRMFLFIPYGLTLIFPFIDSLTLSIKYRTPVMFWHTPICFVLSILIIKESLLQLLRNKPNLGTYE